MRVFKALLLPLLLILSLIGVDNLPGAPGASRAGDDVHALPSPERGGEAGL